MGFSSLGIGSTALQAAQYALDTVGHNLANSSTDGYTRQRVSTEAGSPNVRSFGAIGTGTQIDSVKRIADDFLEQQVRSALSTSENLGELVNGYEKLETYFNELSDNDISSSMDSFWSAASDVSINVEDISTRNAFLEESVSLASSFNSLDDNLGSLRSELNNDVVDTVDQVNALIKEIADLNSSIVKVESGGATGVMANDLRDQREVRLKELSEIMDVTITEEINGSVTVSQQNRFLVYQNKYYELTTKPEISEDGFRALVPVFAEDGKEVSVSDGLLDAQLEMRDEIIPSYQEEVDQLAASMLWEVNRIVSQGCGLEGYSSITGTSLVFNPEATLDSLEYTFDTMPGTYEITNGNFELVVLNASSGEEVTVNVEIDLDGNSADPDTILYDYSDPTAANSLINKMQAALDSVDNGAFTVSLNSNNEISIVSNTEDYQLGFGRDTSGVVAALGLNTLFTGHDAGSIAVNPYTYDNPQYLACSEGFTEGDNQTILALIDLQDTEVMDGDTATLDDFYQGIVGRLGIEASRLDSQYATQQDILTQAENQRETLSGVNLDEEMTKLIQYQRSYQSAARFITVVDECYETLINM